MKHKLTNEEIKAVEDSIEHWEEDIRKKLLNGDTINNSFPKSWNTKTEGGIINTRTVKMYDDSCPLCLLVKRDNSGYRICFRCSFYKKHKYYCTDTTFGEWHVFDCNPTLKNCNKMIKALKDILK